MIRRAFRIGAGCAVHACDGQVAGVMDIRASVISDAGQAWGRTLQVPLCAGHTEEMRDSPGHPPAMIDGRPARVYRAVVVEAQLVVDGEPYP